MSFFSDIGKEISRPFKQVKNEIKRNNSLSDLRNSPLEFLLNPYLLGTGAGDAVSAEYGRVEDNVKAELSRFDDRLRDAFAPQGPEGYTQPPINYQNPYNPQGGANLGQPSPESVLQSYFGNSSQFRPDTQAYQSPFGPSPFANLSQQPAQFAPPPAQNAPPPAQNQPQLPGLIPGRLHPRLIASLLGE